MKVTKFAHSCVLVEDDDKTVLLDPGMYSWQDGNVDVNNLPKLDEIIVTHKHQDHLSEPFVRALNGSQPDALWIAPPDAHEQLKGYGIKNVTAESTANTKVTIVDHANVVPFGSPAQNLVVHWNNKVTDPGDTHDFGETMDLLLLPVQAPWGTTIRALELGLELRPKYILPIHDWMWVDEWRDKVYDSMVRVFEATPTTVLRPVNGQPTEVDL